MPQQQKQTADKIHSVLQHCSFFAGIPGDAYPQILACLHASRRDYPKDASILDIGDRCPLSGVVLCGTLEISLLDENGSELQVNRITSGQGFGMAMACSGQTICPIRLRAVRNCSLLFLDFGKLTDPDTPSFPGQLQILSNLLRETAQQTVFLNRRLRIIGQKRLRDKIKVFLQDQKRQPDGSIRLPFNRSTLADYLYADRSALSRELSRMAAEGILQVDRQTIRILDASFLEGSSS